MDQFNDFICFRLGSLSRRIIRYYNSRFAALGITLGQSFVLFSLLDHDRGSVKEIAAAVQLDSPAVTGWGDGWFTDGLWEGQGDPEDRRSIQVCLTTHGRQVANEALVIAREFNLCMAENQDQEIINKWEQRLEELEQVAAKTVDKPQQ